MKALDVTSCKYDGICAPAALGALAAACPKLRTLHAGYATAVTVESFRAALPSSTSIPHSTLSIINSTGAGGSAATAVASNATAATTAGGSFFLEDAALAYCEQVDDECLLLLAAGAAKFGRAVRRLDVGACPRITAAGLGGVVAASGAWLEALDVSGCDRVVLGELTAHLERSAAQGTFIKKSLATFLSIVAISASTTLLFGLCDQCALLVFMA